VDFRNTVIVMTSNIGSQYFFQQNLSPERQQELVMQEVQATFRPEFLNRVDEIVLFKPLTLEEIERIVELQIADVRRRLEDRRLALELTEDARVLIARLGYDPVYGARPLRRFIQREVETRIARALLSGEIRDGATILLRAEDDEVVVRWRRPDEPAPEAEAVGAAA
jgi:ATP-dependent Clp protease ATP-binding subunit ClpB